MKSVFLFLLILFVLASVGTADTLRVVNYNALNLRGSTMGNRTDDFHTVMESIQPDIAVFQEIIDQDAVDNLLSFVFLQIDDDWSSVVFNNGPDTDNAFFFRTSKVEFISQRAIPTTLRDITEYKFRPLALNEDEEVRFYSGHLKASSGSENEERRRQEAAALRQQLDMLPAGAYFAFMGDFNLYTSEEPAYQLLLNPEPDSDGQLFDPIDTPGDWNNSVSYAHIHTQSTRSSSIGDGGATGGLDDRFDFILVSGGLMDEQNGSYVIPESYKPWGNDGQHFNQSINDGTNNAVPQEVADALHVASDHLPVVVDIVFEPTSDANTPPTIPESAVLLSCYPNPFNSTLTVDISGLKQEGHLRVFDLQGRIVLSEILSPGTGVSQSRTFDFASLTTGIYFVNLSH
ncbi:T9SS type A sorting domain-containing protein, partial [bacterium]|nr:T9SS type A sorting domain-containing protein [bacterium]